MRVVDFCILTIAAYGFENIFVFGENLFTIPDHLTAACKILNLCFNRQKLIDIEKVFIELGKCYNGDIEKQIQQKYDKTCRFV